METKDSIMISRRRRDNLEIFARCHLVHLRGNQHGSRSFKCCIHFFTTRMRVCHSGWKWRLGVSEDLNNTVHGQCVREGPKQAFRGFWYSCGSPDRTFWPCQSRRETQNGTRTNKLLAGLAVCCLENLCPATSRRRKKMKIEE